MSGSNFKPGTKVAFAGGGITVVSRTYVSGTQLRVTVTVAASATSGLRKINVTNPDGGRSTCSCLTIT